MNIRYIPIIIWQHLTDGVSLAIYFALNCFPEDEFHFDKPKKSQEHCLIVLHIIIGCFMMNIIWGRKYALVSKKVSKNPSQHIVHTGRAVHTNNHCQCFHLQRSAGVKNAITMKNCNNIGRSNIDCRLQTHIWHASTLPVPFQILKENDYWRSVMLSSCLINASTLKCLTIKMGQFIMKDRNSEKSCLREVFPRAWVWVFPRAWVVSFSSCNKGASKPGWEKYPPERSDRSQWKAR